MSDAALLNVETWSGKDRQDENFPVGSLAIARQYRAPIHCFYRFARNADDIADSPALSAPDKIARRLQTARSELARAGEFDRIMVNADISAAVRTLTCLTQHAFRYRG